MSRFHSACTVLVVLVLALAGQTLGAKKDDWLTGGNAEKFLDLLAERGAARGLPRLRHGRDFYGQVPVGILKQGGGPQAALPAPGDRGLFQQFGQLLRSSAARAAGPGGSEDATRLMREEGPRIMADLGLWDTLDEAVDVEELAARVSQELGQFVGTNAWRNVSSLCLNNTLQLFEDASQGLPYAGQMLNSRADRIDANVFYTLKFYKYGNVEQCLAVKEWNPEAPFDTQYCDVGYPYLLETYVRRGVCFPANCSQNDLRELFKPIPIIGQYMYFDCMVDYPWNAAAIATVCMLSFLLLLVTLGTTYHVVAHGKMKTSMKQKEARLEEKAEKVVEGMSLDEKSVKKKPVVMYYGSTVTANGIGETNLEKNGYAHQNNGFVVDDAEKPAANGKGPQAITLAEQDAKTIKKQPKTSGPLDTIMMGFSSIHNGSKILNTQQPAGSLGVLNGIRVISMWWIILGHSIYFMLLGYYDDNAVLIRELSSSFLFSVIVNASVSVDSFFFLSGLLLTYLTLKHLKKANGRINWALFYLHRFIRITPAYMISIAIWASLAIHFGKGPGKIAMFEGAATFCREYWWTNLLYINNLYPFPGDLEEQCLGWSWYLANDMQFFVISPFIIYLLYKNSKWGMSLIIALCLGSFGVTAYLAAYYGAPVGLIPAYNNNSLVVYGNAAADVIYGKPYCRIPAYLVGMVFGYIFYKVNGRPFQMSKVLNMFMWFLSTAVAVTIVYGLYRREGGSLPQYAAVLYTVFARPAFVMAVGWVAFSCTVGYGGPVNTLLSWGFWAPLSRITYGAYLLHPITMYTIYTSANSLYHFTYMQAACMFIANMVIAYAAAFVLSIGVEGPIMGLEKALLGGGARGKKK